MADFSALLTDVVLCDGQLLVYVLKLLEVLLRNVLVRNQIKFKVSILGAIKDSDEVFGLPLLNLIMFSAFIKAFYLANVVRASIRDPDKGSLNTKLVGWMLQEFAYFTSLETYLLK